MDKEWIAWAAGIIDGEGSIQMIKGIDKRNHNKPYIRCKLTIVNTDYRILDKFDEVVFCLTRNRMTRYVVPEGKKYGYNWKERKVYSINKRSTLMHFLVSVYPFLIGKMRQAELMIRHLAKPTGDKYSLSDWEIYEELKDLNKRGGITMETEKKVTLSPSTMEVA